MKRVIVVLMLVAVGAVCFAGCSGSWPFKWKPTEEQKQAGDLTVKDIQALEPHVDNAGEPIRREALVGAEVTQTYLGLPKKRLQPVSPANEPILQQAATDANANQPAPTTGQVGQAMIDEAAQATTAGFTLAQLILGAASSVAGVWGYGRVKRRVDGWKDRAGTAEIKANETIEAIREIVRGVDLLDPETKAKVKILQQQSSQTKRLVADAKKF